MKIGILISGRGSNMLAISKAVRDGTIPDSEIAVVISDRPKAEGLRKASELGIEAVSVPRKGRSRAGHDADIMAELGKRRVELVCLAGYMRLLSKGFVLEYKNRILNIHPSLLPSFKGLEAQKQAIDYGVKISGCTVHFVDEDLDHGAIILQKAVEVHDSDTPESLAARIIAHEHETYVKAVALVVGGRYRIEGRRVVFGDGGISAAPGG